MASLSSTHASKHRQWPSPLLRPPNSHPEASRSFRLSSPSGRPDFFSGDSYSQICCCSSSGFPFHRRRPFLGFLSHCNRRSCSFRAGRSDPNPSPPSPSPTDPPPRQGESVTGALSRVQDNVRIFFAVFFWMALFFWGSAWDGRNGGKRNKGNRFKR